MHLKEDALAGPKPPSTLSGLPPEATMEDPGLCPSPSVLGWEGQPARPNEPCHMVMCVHELRQVMKLYMTFSDHDVFKGLTHKTHEVRVKEAMQPNPTESTPADDPATGMTTPSALVDESAALITTPSIPAEESVALITTPAVLADEPADPTAIPEATSDARKTKDPEYPKWLKSPSIPSGGLCGECSPTLGDLRWCCHNCSSSQSRAWCHLVEEQWALKGDSSSALPQSSPEPAHHREEDPGAQLKALPPGFREITNSLTRGRPLEMGIYCPLTVASPGLSAGSAVAKVTSTGVCQDQTMGTIYLTMVTTSMGLMNLETPLWHLATGGQP